MEVLAKKFNNVSSRPCETKEGSNREIKRLIESMKSAFIPESCKIQVPNKQIVDMRIKAK